MVPCDAITIPIVDLAPWKEDARKVNEPLSSNSFHSGSPSGPSGPRPGLASGPIFPSPGFTLRQQPFLHRCPHILDNPQKRSSHDSFFKHLTTQATKGQPCISQEEQGKTIIPTIIDFFSIDLSFFVQVTPFVHHHNLHSFNLNLRYG